MNNGLSGQLDGPSSSLMKSPMHQRPDSEARDMTEAFIKKYARKPLPASAKRKAKTGKD
jgi:myo-inositol-1-phosphate synthase